MRAGTLEMRIVAVLLAVPALLVGGPGRAASDVGALLRELAPAEPPQGAVAVTGWIERAPAGTELVVRVEGQGAAKLVAEPGVMVTALPRHGLAWGAERATSSAGSGAYHERPVELRLPFTTRDTAPIEAAVEYAYCLVDYQCLFGASRVSVVPEPACPVSAAATSSC